VSVKEKGMQEARRSDHVLKERALEIHIVDSFAFNLSGLPKQVTDG